MKNLDEVFDIYEAFLIQTRTYDHFESARADEEGNERILLKFSCGFNVELTNKKDIENSAALRCWGRDSKKIIEISTVDQLLQEFEKFRSYMFLCKKISYLFKIICEN